MDKPDATGGTGGAAVLNVWVIHPTHTRLDVITWAGGTAEPVFETGEARAIFNTYWGRFGNVADTVAFLTGWTNGYVGIYTPGREPWLNP
jgi:hypothetical protein